MKTIQLFTTAFGIAAVSCASVCSEESTPKGLSVSEWSSIREAYDVGRHAVRRQENGTYAARNPGQRWRTEFDRRGFFVRPDHGQWTWGLELQAVGTHNSSACSHITFRDNKLSYHWGENVEEWFINDRRGLEQGWTLQNPLVAGNIGVAEHRALTLTLKIRGDLSPRISKDHRSIAFQTTAGTAALTYGGLRAWDAAGRTLEVRFTPTGDSTSFCIAIDDTRATYPITVDPIAQQAYLKASNTASNDAFGSSVAVSGDTVVIGAVGEDSAATGVGGDQANNAASGSGAAYVFTRSGGTWTQQAYLKASNTGSNDAFGYSVAISGDTVVVGAVGEDSNETGTAGTGASNSASDSGAAYVFVRSGTTWTQQAYLKASNTGAGDEFGYSVAISGETVIVGAFWEDSAATGINGDQANTSAPGAGAAYVFLRGGTAWSQQVYLKASNSGNSDHFGTSVAISDDTAIIGAILEDSAATGVNGNQANETVLDSGAAYVFVRSGATWSQQAYLKASNTDTSDDFGISVTVSGNTAVVGAEREQSNATGVNGNGSDNSQPFAGAAYVFVRSGTTWSQQAYLKASNTAAGDRFGRVVGISGEKLVVGAFGEDGAATGVNGNQNNRSASSAGAGYLFVRSGDTWSQQAYLKASNTSASDEFGSAVAIAGDTAIAVSKGEDSAATGVNENQGDNSAFDSGAAYVFNLNVPAISEIAVEQPSGTDLTSGVAAVDFGILFAGSDTATQGFVIRSAGTVDLTGITASVVGENKDDFVITTSPAATVAFGSFTNLVVRFSPSASGDRTATLSIASNDLDENPFLVSLTGKGMTYARQLFDAAIAAAGLTGLDAEPGAIPFKDGVNNLLKYAFNMNFAGLDTHTLAAGGDSGLPNGILIEESGQTYWQCQFMWNNGNGLVYTPMKSIDLHFFEPMTGGVTYESIDDVWYRVTVKEPIDFETTLKLFVRVEVTLP
jgi:hypothetical protein